jgi:azurin
MLACALGGAQLSAQQVQPGQRSGAAPPRTVVITVGNPVGEKMNYSVSQITATAGERLRIRLINTGSMPKTVMAHNFVLLTRGANAKAFAETAAKAKATDFIPPGLRSHILAQTGLIGPNESAEVIVTVPKAAGTYPYLCTFAGHYAAGMNGVLVVK